MNKKIICLLSVLLLLVGMACSCNLLNFIVGEKEDEIALSDHEDMEEEAEEPVEEHPAPTDVIEEAVEEDSDDDGPSPLQHVDEDDEEAAEEVHEAVEEEAEDTLTGDEMGTQPNWSLAVTGCEEYFEEGDLSGFYPSDSMDEIEFTGEDHILILSMTKDWRNEQLWFSDFTNDDVTDNSIDFVIYDHDNGTYIFLPDYVSFYWEYDGDEQTIFGIIDFDATAFTADGSSVYSPSCVISGQFAFDNLPID